MLIDWFTVVAQAINFIVLVALMKHFLYRPILSAIAAREQKVAAQLAEADARQAQALAERAELARKNAEFDAERAQLLAAANAQAQALRDKLLAQAEAEAQALAVARRKAMDEETAAYGAELSRRTGQEVLAIAGKLLGELSDSTLERRVVEQFLARLAALPAPARAALAQALLQPGAPVEVRSAFALGDDQRAAIRGALAGLGGEGAQLRFASAPELVCGIELSAGGQQFGWNVADSLQSLQGGVSAALAAPAVPA